MLEYSIRYYTFAHESSLYIHNIRPNKEYQPVNLILTIGDALSTHTRKSQAVPSTRAKAPIQACFSMALESSNSYMAALAIKFNGFSKIIGRIQLLRISIMVWVQLGPRTPPPLQTNAWIKGCKCYSLHRNNRSYQTRIRVRRPKLLRVLRRIIIQWIERLRWFYNPNAVLIKKIIKIRRNSKESSITFSSHIQNKSLNNHKTQQLSTSIKILCELDSNSSNNKAVHLMEVWNNNKHSLERIMRRYRLCHQHPLSNRVSHQWWEEITKARTIHLLRIERIALC